jgi:hypothetical protein
MSSPLNSVDLTQKADGSWQAYHVPSGKTAHGLTQEEAESSMREMLGLNNLGKFTEPLTSYKRHCFIFRGRCFRNACTAFWLCSFRCL